jgi:hypothetical protein
MNAAMYRKALAALLICLWIALSGADLVEDLDLPNRIEFDDRALSGAGYSLHSRALCVLPQDTSGPVFTFGSTLRWSESHLDHKPPWRSTNSSLQFSPT